MCNPASPKINKVRSRASREASPTSALPWAPQSQAPSLSPNSRRQEFLDVLAMVSLAVLALIGLAAAILLHQAHLSSYQPDACRTRVPDALGTATSSQPLARGALTAHYNASPLASGNRTTLRSSGISRRRVPERRAGAKRSWPLGLRPRFSSENGSVIWPRNLKRSKTNGRPSLTNSG